MIGTDFDKDFLNKIFNLWNFMDFVLQFFIGNYYDEI
jgi:hypothetical protein